MTKAEVILNAISSGVATDEELLLLENTPESEFAIDSIGLKDQTLPGYNEDDLKPIQATEVKEVEEEEITAPKVKEVLSPEDTTVKEDDMVSTGVENSTDIPENDEYDFNVGVLPEVKIEGVLPEVKSEAFNFLQSDNEEEYKKNIKTFFNSSEENAQTQLKTILKLECELWR